MLSFLKNHPFGVEAFLEYSYVFTFALPKQEIESLIPPCLELDTYNTDWAFIAVAMVQTRGLRPKGVPEIFGNDFFLVGYRIFTRYITNAGKRLRGLYILESETDKKKMELLGTIFTRYKYTTSNIRQELHGGIFKIFSEKSDFKVSIEIQAPEPIPLPPGSPFRDWKEARRFAGPLPFTFSYLPDTGKVLIVEGIRENWIPRPVQVYEHNFSFLNKMNLRGLRLANAFIIENIPYSWKKGKLELWKKV